MLCIWAKNAWKDLDIIISQAFHSLSLSVRMHFDVVSYLVPQSLLVCFTSSYFGCLNSLICVFLFQDSCIYACFAPASACGTLSFDIWCSLRSLSKWYNVKLIQFFLFCDNNSIGLWWLPGYSFYHTFLMMLHPLSFITSFI